MRALLVCVTSLGLLGCGGARTASGAGAEEGAGGEESSSGAEDEGGESTGSEGGETGGVGDDLPDELDCGSIDFVFEHHLPYLQLVVERSAAASLHFYDHDGDPGTPEVSAQSILDEFILGSWQMFDQDNACNLAYAHLAVAGTEMASIPQAQACDFTPAQAVTANSAIELSPSLQEWGEPTGASPLTKAYTSAVDVLFELPELEFGAAAVALVLNTPPNCGADDEFELLDPGLELAIAQAHDAGVFTLVFVADQETPGDGQGLPGVPDQVDRLAYFDALAAASEYPIRPALPEALADELQWGSGLVTCDIDLTVPPNQGLTPERYIEEFVINEIAYPYLGEMDQCPEGADGVIGINVEEPGFVEHMRLCGAACEVLKCHNYAPGEWDIEMDAQIYCHPGH